MLNYNVCATDQTKIEYINNLYYNTLRCCESFFPCYARSLWMSFPCPELLRVGELTNEQRLSTSEWLDAAMNGADEKYTTHCTFYECRCFEVLQHTRDSSKTTCYRGYYYFFPGTLLQQVLRREKKGGNLAFSRVFQSFAVNRRQPALLVQDIKNSLLMRIKLVH